MVVNSHFIQKTILFISCLIGLTNAHAESSISISIPSPYTRNQSAETLFFQKHFSFELFYNYENEKYNLEVININSDTDEMTYFKQCKEENIKNNFDYLLYSAVYSNKNYLFLKISLINPFTNYIIYSKLFITKADYTLSDNLTDICQEIAGIISGMTLKKNIYKPVKKKLPETEPEEKLTAMNPKYRHEIFFLNSFFKAHASVISFMEIYAGYNFSPFNFFSVESGSFFGYGQKNLNFYFTNYQLDTTYLGTFAGAFFFFPFILEPSIGVKFELNYLFNTNELLLSIPIDVGLKFYISPKDAIRLDSSFQFTAFNISKSLWENNFIIGFMIGYAKKI